MDRRGFIKELGAIGAVGATLSLFPWMQSCSPTAKEQIKGEKIRLGIIGPGSRGQYHMKHILMIENAEITALCD